jgi:CPA1 family monovalent cation:H+ antiporter
MLSFMLFAGAIHIRMDLLNHEKIPIMVFSTLSVLLSAFIIGILSYCLLMLFGLQVRFIYCLLFGSLISPTDPLAVLGILREAKISKSLEMKLSGESLFNDGISIVLFLTIIQAARLPDSFSWLDVVNLFAKQALGGIMLGIAIGFIGYRMIRSINNYKVEVMITLAIVMGGYALANVLNVSGPLAMVMAGILVGNYRKSHTDSRTTSNYVDRFWEVIDDTLNSILFVLMGFELLVIRFNPVYFVLGIFTIVIVLLARYISILLPAQLLKLRENITHNTILILTWGGLRGGLSFALALSLQSEMHKDLWVTLTYFVVSFSILVQGLTIGKFASQRK